MPFPLPINAPAELSEWVATLGAHFDENQRVRSLGYIGDGAGSYTLRFLASAATGHVRVHQQVSGTYAAGAPDFTSDVDCRPNRQQEVALDIADGTHVWLIPLWDDQGTLRAFNGTDGPDHMTYVQIDPYMTAAELLAALLTVDGAGSGLDADLLDGLQGAEYAVLAAALNEFTGDMEVAGSITAGVDLKVYEAGARSSVVMEYDHGETASVKFNTGADAALEARWEVLAFADDDDGDEDGGELGFRAFDDDGASIGFPLTLYRDLSALFTGDVEVEKTDPRLVLGESSVGNRIMTLEALQAAGSGCHIVMEGSGPHGIEIHPLGSLESALYYRTAPKSWSFEDSIGTKILEIDIDDDTVVVNGHFSAAGGAVYTTGTTTPVLVLKAGSTGAQFRLNSEADDLRWIIALNDDDDDGDNDGGELRIVPRTDAGGAIGDLLTLHRDNNMLAAFGGDISIDGSLVAQWNILHDVMIKLRGVDSNPGSGVEWGARIGFGAGLNPPYIAGIQLGGDPDTAGLSFHCHPSGTSADPTVEALRLNGNVAGTNQTSLFILHNAGGGVGTQFERVTVGAADTGDAGFRCLQVPN